MKITWDATNNGFWGKIHVASVERNSTRPKDEPNKFGASIHLPCTKGMAYKTKYFQEPEQAREYCQRVADNWQTDAGFTAWRSTQ